MMGETLAAMGDDPIACLCSDRVLRTNSSSSESNRGILTEPHCFSQIPRRGASEPVLVRL
jgi:hypothetical protein